MSKDLPNIAIWARSGAGKSFATAYLKEHYGYEVCRPGAICREITLRLFGTDSKAMLNSVNDALRSIEPDIWLRLGYEEMKRHDGVVIDGIRFKSNLAFCRARNFRLVKIVASETIRLRRLQARGQTFDPLTDGFHAGEVEIEDAPFDFTVWNDDDDPVALYQQLDEVVGAKLG